MTDDQSAQNSSSEAVQGAHKRNSLWGSALETAAFMRSALSDKSIELRDEDKFSSRILSIFIFVGLSAICVSAYLQDWAFLRTRLGAGGFTPFRPFNLVVLGAVDVLYFLPLCWFVFNRMGILRTMSKRHAVICCQLMIGASILTALVCVNIAVIILLVCLGNSMHLIVG
jgi:hypothetical protein